MTSKQRVAAAIRFEKPDRVPRFWQDFWPEFQEEWRRARPEADIHDYFGDDVHLVQPDETPWPTRARVVRQSKSEVIVRSGWGELKRTVAQDHYGQQVMGETLEVAFPQRVDPDTMQFDDPLLDQRYEKAGAQARTWREERFVLTKTGGPYLRAAFLRGEQDFWFDIADDPQWAKAFVERVVDHLIAVGVESIRRFGLQDSGIGIYDDVASNAGPMMGPASYERIFLPSLRRMVAAYRAAGASTILHHSDGNVMPLLEMWIDAGIDAINPVEPRAGMDAVTILEKFGGTLVCMGGLDNSIILPRGEPAEVRDHVLRLLRAGEAGGLVIGPHSIGPDVSIETMDYVLELLNDRSRSGGDVSSH
jgi:uroporphyrinogen decarboxylase